MTIKNKKPILFIFIILSLLALFVLGVFIIPRTIENSANLSHIETKLEEKYHEDFTDLTLIKSQDNLDHYIFNMDGTHLGPVKGEGSTGYYKIYSPKHDLEFVASYNTADQSLKDTYKTALKKRTALTEAYAIIHQYLDAPIFLTGSSSHDNIPINSKSQLYEILSRYKDEHLGFTNLEIVINANLFDFSKSNYSTLAQLNDALSTLKASSDYDFVTVITLNNDKVIRLADPNGKAYVFDTPGETTAWQEPLEDFVQRDSYQESED